MPTVRGGPAIGLSAQLAVLAALAATVGLGGAGWLVGTGYAVVTCLALSRGLRRAGASRLGPADRVTLTRAVLVGAVTALVVDSFVRPAPVALLVAVSAVALLLDAVDGQVARRTGTVSALGARFDMEVDAFLILVLSVYVAPSTGAWVLAIGAMRYAFVAAMAVLPWLNGSLPPRFWRKVVAAAQGVLLAVAAARVLPQPWTTLVLVAALALLVESFGRDVAWLWRHRPAHQRPRPASVPVTVAPARVTAPRVPAPVALPLLPSGGHTPVVVPPLVPVRAMAARSGATVHSDWRL
ncbi:CDP-alcohol phosphatidyltransferase family protein [Micromonospora sp. ALFpr18c]|uniref:CDP-alcohol phosphatidyltransferase family protein n=1 Tax=Micromonospora sp. ALFpr18c TaxID=1458665 RepID=UPI00124BA450|nr:CDP-alcohol phosphatidyltransferase family protein [Micromonospora sp. ALFpr18c]KAB1941388.1 CDP-alcohol phosphatidyltransferase family protein [Micromonospora sp. ALFpr18c]